MTIRLNKKDYDKLIKLPNKNKDEFVIDETCNEPEVSYKQNEKNIKLWIKGFKIVKNYLIFGYNRIIKKCPKRLFLNCIGNKCQFYFVENLTGDCIEVWKTIMEISRK